MKNLAQTVELTMETVILYDDIAFAEKAYATLLRVGGKDEVGIDWVVKFWPAKALKDASLADKALAESLNAHLVVLPAHLAETPAHWLLSWLKRWTQQREFEEAALGIIAERGTDDLIRPISGELSQLILQGGLQLIADPGLNTEGTVEYSVTNSRPQEILLPLTRLDTRELAACYSYRGIGIND
jgi:hypothetical protein